MLVAGTVIFYRLWKSSHPETVLHTLGLANLDQLGPTWIIQFLKGPFGSQLLAPRAPYYVEWHFVRVSVRPAWLAFSWGICLVSRGKFSRRNTPSTARNIGD